LENIGQTMQAHNQQQDQARHNGSIYRERILDDLVASFAHLGMLRQQEEEILEMVRDRSNNLTDLYDVSDETQATFGALSAKLEVILTATAGTTTPHAIAESGL
jgi:hypothetical protein